MKLLRYVLFALLSAVVGVLTVFIFQPKPQLTVVTSVTAPQQATTPKTWQEEVAANPISEISLERRGGFVGVTLYDITFLKAGQATYHRAYSQRQGAFGGALDKADFYRLSELIESSNFFALEDSYPSQMSDVPATIISVVRNGERKTIEIEGHAPVELWGIEQAIGNLASQMKWRKMSRK